MPGAISANTRCWPCPAGLVDGYKNGYKGNVRLNNPTSYSPEVEAYYSKACRFWNAGFIEDSWKMGVLSDNWTKQWRNIQSEAIVSVLRSLQKQIANWVEDTSYSDDCPVRLWYSWLAQGNEALEQTNAFMRERSSDPSKKTLYQPQTYLGPESIRDDPTQDPYSVVAIDYTAHSVKDIQVTNANYPSERKPKPSPPPPPPQSKSFQFAWKKSALAIKMKSLHCRL